MAKGKKKRTPSRIRYEQSHPTVSWRVSEELYDKLQVVKEAEGKSVTDVFKVGIGLLEVKVSKEKEAGEQGEDINLTQGTVTIQHLKSRIKLACPQCGARLGKSHSYCARCGIKVNKLVASWDDAGAVPCW